MKPKLETELVNSVSYTALEEDAIVSLMMLFRDIWMRDFRKIPFEESEDEENELEHEEE